MNEQLCAGEVCGLVLAGQVRNQGYGPGGRRRIVNLILPRALFDGYGIVRPGHALEAATPVQFLCIPRRAFNRLVWDDSWLHHAVSRSAQAQLERVGQLVQALVVPYSRARVCVLPDLVFRWAPCNPLPTGDCVFDLPISSRDIGDLLALSTEAVERAFHTLEPEGLIGREAPDRPAIHRPAALRAIVVASGRTV